MSSDVIHVELDPVEPSKPRKPRWLVPVIGGLTVLVIALGGLVVWLLPAGLGSSEANPEAATTTATSKTVTAALTLQGGFWAGPSCSGNGGYDDIRAGASVVVTDATGKTVGIGSLSAGEVVPASMRSECRFTASVSDVPTGSNFYAIEVSHRGKVQFSAAQMDSTIQLTLG